VPVVDRLTRQRARIVRTIHRSGTASQRDLSRATHLNTGSISVLCRQLLADGMIEVAGTEAAGVGRPLTLFRLAAMAGRAIGIGIDEDQISAVSIDLAGGVLAHSLSALGPCRSNDDLLTAIDSAIAPMVERPAGARVPLLGIGVALPGVVDYMAGICRFCSRIPGPRDVPVRAALARQWDVHSTVDDYVRAMAIAEHRYGAARRVRDFLYVVADTSVGAALFLDGRPYRGTRGMSGEVGHIVVDLTGPWCGCGKRGCLEVIVGRRAIEQVAEQVAGNAAGASLAGMAAAAAHGEQFPVKLLTYAGERLGQCIATAINVVGVELVVLGGCVPLASPLVVDAVRTAARLGTVAGIDPVIELSALDDTAAARGAATLALDELFAEDGHALAVTATKKERVA